MKTKEDAEYGSNDGPVGGLILHAPFLSVYRVVVDTGCTLYGDKFPNLDVISMVNSPTLLIHGTSDQIVPFHHSERLFEALPKNCQARPLYIEGMSHNNVHAQVRPMFVDRVLEYLEDHVWDNVVSRTQIVRKPSSASTRSSSRRWEIVAETDWGAFSYTWLVKFYTICKLNLARRGGLSLGPRTTYLRGIRGKITISIRE